MMRNDDRSVKESTNLTIFSIFDINKMKIKNNKKYFKTKMTKKYF